MTSATENEDNSGLRLIRRPANQRGVADFGWLKSSHSFSFGQYFDPRHVGFGNLIVINDDTVAGGRGFGAHPHKNAEIFSYVLSGALEHKDSMGNGSIVHKGGVQYMSAGSGVTHSEFNPSATDETHFLQVWLVPEIENTLPAYSTMQLTATDTDGALKLFLSRDGRDGSMLTHANASVYAATLSRGQGISHNISARRKAWVQVARGSLRVNEVDLQTGDGLAIDGAGTLIFSEGQDAEFLFFELTA